MPATPKHVDRTTPTIVPIPPAFVQNEELESLSDGDDELVGEGTVVAMEPGVAAPCEPSELLEGVADAELPNGAKFESTLCKLNLEFEKYGFKKYEELSYP